jgi:hypothetical protein
MLLTLLSSAGDSRTTLRLTSGSSQRLEISTSVIDFNDKYTASLWIKPMSVGGGTERHVWNIQGSTHDYGDMDALTIDSSGALKMTVVIGYDVEAVTGSTLDADTYYHVAVVREDATTVKVYLDGTLDITVTKDTTGRDAAAYWNLGAYYDGGAFNFYNGLMWGMKAWTDALSGGERTAELTQGHPVRTANLYGYWDFEEVDPELDDSGNGHDWTTYNSPTLEVSPPDIPLEAGVTVTPSTAALTLTTFAPVVRTDIVVPVATLTTATFAPVIGTRIDVPVATLTTSAFAPVLGMRIDVPTTALSTAGLAPVVVTTIVVADAAISTSTFAPTLRSDIVVPTATLTLTTFAPVLETRITPDVASLSITTFAPDLPTVATPDTASLTLTTFAPVVSTTDNVTVTPDTASLTTAGYEPVLVTTVTPQLAELSITAYEPTIDIDSGDVTTTPDTAALTITTFAPEVTTTEDVTVTPDTASLTVIGLAPVLRHVITTSTTALAITRYPPSIASGLVVPTAELTLTTFAPDISIGSASDVTLTPDVASLTLTTYAPTAVTTIRLTGTEKHTLRKDFLNVVESPSEGAVEIEVVFDNDGGMRFYVVP